MWTLGGTRIFVTKISDGVKHVIAQLQPIAGGTVYHSFGYQTDQYKVEAKVVGSGDVSHLKSLTTSGNSSFELMSPEGDLGDFFVAAVDVSRDNSIFQTLRRDLDCETPVYTLEIELYQDF